MRIFPAQRSVSIIFVEDLKGVFKVFRGGFCAAALGTRSGPLFGVKGDRRPRQAVLHEELQTGCTWRGSSRAISL